VSTVILVETEKKIDETFAGKKKKEDRGLRKKTIGKAYRAEGN